MKKTTILSKRSKGLLAMAIGAFLWSSCSSDDESSTPPDTVEINYALVTESGTYPNNTSYFQGLENIDEEHIDNSKAKEFLQPALLYGHNGGALVSLVGQPATMTRFSFNENGAIVEENSLRDPAGRNFASLCFVDEHDAYAGTVGTGGEYKVIRFDPTTMQKKGEIDISLIKKPDIPTIYIQQIIKRSDKLFMGVYYEKDFNPAIDEAFVAIVDIPTQKVEKLINDDRTSRIFIGYNDGTLNLMPNGDIYVMAYGTANKPSGILRIRNDEYDFDENYFMNLDQLTGGICRGLFPYTENKALTLKIDDPGDEWELNGPNYSYYMIDIVNETTEGRVDGLPVVYGANPAFLKKIDNQWLLNAAVDGSSTVYDFNPASGSVTKKFTVDGKLNSLARLK